MHPGQERPQRTRPQLVLPPCPSEACRRAAFRSKARPAANWRQSPSPLFRHAHNMLAPLNILLGVNFYLALLIGSIIAAVVGAITLLPLLRIGGFYFALATLGINFVFFDIFHNLAPRVEGSEGLYGLQLPDLLASSAPRFATTVAVAIA